jgi:hypothetical protein
MFDPTSSVGDSPAKTLASPGKAQVSPKAPVADCGPTMPMPFASFDPEAFLWRTSQLSLLEDLTVYAETWPRAGTMRSGIAYQRPASAPRTYATEFSLSRIAPTLVDGPTNTEGLVPTPVADGDRRTMFAQGGMPLGVAVRMVPTPTVGDSKSARNSTAIRSGDSTANSGTTLTDFVDPTNGGRLLPTPRANKVGGYSSPGYSPTLTQALGLLPTPTSPEHKYRIGGDSQQSNSLGGKAARGDLGEHQPGRTGGALNPAWVEWLQGFPEGWTDCDASVTPSSHR